jgi:hypothetical protein
MALEWKLAAIVGRMEYQEGRMRKQLSFAAMGFCLYILLHLSAWARPATKGDYEGKTLCWDDGVSKETYYAGGKFDNNIDGQGTWDIKEYGVFVYKFDRYPKSFVGKVEMNDNGTITYTGPYPGSDEGSGVAQYCK